ncbi:MAG: universal stress protein [Labilithrix sp.]|nr:universal stress protein [Labilithrix sp.]MCW5817276.1 universal stress protein [Labilithrix sp.]
MRLSHILVPIDFGPASDRACALAAEIAPKLESKITLLHVWSMPLPAYAEGIVFPFDAMEAAARSKLEQARARVKERLPNVEIALSMGVAWDRIVETAKEHDVDMIVMGTHGRHGAPRWLLGSVAEKVVRLSPVPVLTVHADRDRA